MLAGFYHPFQTPLAQFFSTWAHIRMRVLTSEYPIGSAFAYHRDRVLGYDIRVSRLIFSHKRSTAVL